MVTPFEESECPECRRLNKRRQLLRKDSPLALTPYYETICACLCCINILKHLEAKHPETVALVELTNPKIFEQRRRYAQSYAQFR